MTQFYLKLTTLFSFFSLTVCAQSYYPGGMGNTNLIVWLNANKTSSITQNGSSQVSQWADLSGNGYNFTQTTNGNKPVYGATQSPSGMPAIAFTSTSSQYLSLASLPATSFTAGVSAFSVASYNASQTAQGWQRIFDFANGSADNNFMMGRDGSTADSYYESWNGTTGDQTWVTTSDITDGSENLYEAVQQGGTAGSLSTVSQYLGGTAQTATGQAGSSETYVPANITRTSNFIGRSNWTADNYFSGTMSEILVYNTQFNTTQRMILENYAAAEWNQTIATSKYTPPSTTTYTTNLVGIGYTSSTDNFLADIAGSTDGLGFSSTTTGFLSTAGYLMAAHNAQTNTVIANASVPGITSASSLSRWNRSWDVQKTGGNSAGTVTLNFNFSDYNGTTPTTTNTFALLYNATDGTFATGTNKLVTTSATTVTGNIVSFKVTASNLSNGYYTILYSTSPIVLPLNLTAFTATSQSSSSLLEWSASDLVDFSHFAIERSGDGATFSIIGTVAATDYSTIAGDYSFTDSHPLNGMNEYRLAMVDQDGSTAYSPIRTVSFDSNSDPNVTFSIYPNPATDHLYLTLTNFSGVVNVRLIDIRGQILRTMTTSSGTADITVSDLHKGIYVVEITGTNARLAREFMKN